MKGGKNSKLKSWVFQDTENQAGLASLIFRIRSKTNEIQMNQQSDKCNLWKCLQCGNIDTQSHVIWCPYFANLRDGKSLENDLVAYFREVFRIREDFQNDEEWILTLAEVWSAAQAHSSPALGTESWRGRVVTRERGFSIQNFFLYVFRNNKKK